ncbi:outer membrane beta-barrel protein [Prevotella sp. HCN-7019]|uniref:outer membrane beta-barrel protein n=1 Tax=Prevotella sp. HCN-7019 TaxID=3134668 RepID=UPI0030BAA808
MLPDSIVIDSCINNFGYNNAKDLFCFRVGFGDYIVKTEADGYDTKYTWISIDESYKRESSSFLPAIYMQRTKVHAIGEVVVTATKVKFYNKGDTLVYNADAFQLAEGSMLDALIKQFPGAELKSDGRIYVNGRFVESLLLNGKDFFKGNNRIMLDNLPAYTVKTVKVYDKDGSLSEFMGRDMNDKQLVMDVYLKKQYNIGWMGSIDAGIANEKLYMARLLAIRSTDHSRVSMFGNMNNINDFTTPNTNDWTPDKTPYGRLTSKKAGIDVVVDDRDNKFMYYGNATFDRYDNHQTVNTFRTNFLSDGDIYDRMSQYSDISNMFLRTYNKLTINPGGVGSRVRIDLTQSASYSRLRNDLSDVSATSTETWNGFNDFISLLSSPVLSEELRLRLINRQIENSFSDRKNYNAKLGARSFIRARHNSDYIVFDLNGEIFGEDAKGFTHRRMDFYSGDGSTEFMNRYNDKIPSRGYNLNFMTDYHLGLSGKASVSFTYKLRSGYRKSEDKLYRLENIDGWGLDTEHPLGTLPSVREYLATIDSRNSYNSSLHVNNNDLGVSGMFSVFDNDKSSMNIFPILTLSLQTERFKYSRAVIDTAFTRTTPFLNPSIEMKWYTKDVKCGIEFKYYMENRTPEMLYSVGFVDDADPMVTTNYGNKDLKNKRTHNFSLNFINRKRSTSYSASVTFSTSFNDIAMGYVYDRATGRREYSFYNVDGNRNINMNLNANGPVDKKKRLYFNSSTSWRYINSVDMIGDELTSAPQKSTVRTSVLSEDLNFDYSLGKHSVGMKGSFAWTSSNGDLDNFTTINAYNYNYGLTSMVSLPWNFKLDTDFTVYSRRGYEDTSMNDDNFVWNARLTRSLLKGKLTLRADAFDILHQLKKVERTINTQGRVERYYNTPPRYVLIHAIYRFNIFPKKKI